MMTLTTAYVALIVTFTIGMFAIMGMAIRTWIEDTKKAKAEREFNANYKVDYYVDQNLALVKVVTKR